MRYEDFKAAFRRALEAAQVPVMGWWHEKLDLASMDRTCEIGVEPVGSQDVEPWFVSGKLSFTWHSLHAARTATCEEDMLVELFGREDGAERETIPPVLRVDVAMQANLPWGKAIPMPEPVVWRAWAHEVTTRLDEMERIVSEEMARETDDGMLEILAWQGEPTAEVSVTPSGELRLARVRVAAFQMIELPRIFDDPDREDDHPHEQLVALLKRVKASMYAWKEGIDHLATRPRPAHGK